MSHRSLLVGCPKAACGLLFGLALIALAARGFAAPDPQIETLVVTAHRLPSKDPILPVVRLTPDANAFVGAEVLRHLPNLGLSRSGSFGGVSQVRLRGSEANHVLVLIDGIEMNDPANGSEYNFTHLMPFAASAIEFLPGAQSAIWGSEALAGVIHLTTAPAAAVRTLSVEGGAFDSRRAAFQLADRKAQGYYNLAALSARTDGTNISRSGDERDGYDHLGWQASGGWLHDGWRLSGLVRRNRGASEYDPTPFPDYLPMDGNLHGDHDELLAGATAELDRGRWRHQLRLDHLNTKNQDFGVAGQRTAYSAGQRLKAAYNASWRLGEAHEAQAFVEHQEERFQQKGAPSSFGDPNQRQRLEALSAGLALIGRLGPRLAWSASIRQDGNSAFDDAFTHRLALRYSLPDSTELWLNYGEGIKNPSFFERFGHTPDNFFGNPNLKPEANQHVSLGARVTAGPATLGLALFRDRLKNEIDGFRFVPAAGGFTAVNLAGESKRQGVEVTANARLGEVNLTAGWGYLKAQEPDGGVEIRRPKHSGHLAASYERGRWLFQTAAHLVGERDDFSFASFPAARVRLASYQLLRVATTFRVNEHIELSARLENLLDDDYEDVLGYQNPGRAAYVGVGWHW